MGNTSSLSEDDVKELKVASSFTSEDIKRLYKRFSKLDTDNSGTLSVQEFMAIPDLEHNPLVSRVVSTFDTNRNGEVEFAEFLKSVSIFATDTPAQVKFRFTFKLYDLDGDGFISNGDLYRVLKIMVGSNLNDVQLQQLVDRTILRGDADKDGKLSFKEFVDMVKESDLQDKLRIDL